MPGAWGHSTPQWLPVLLRRQSSQDGPRPPRGADCKNLPYLPVCPNLSDLLAFGLWQVPKLLEPCLLVPERLVVPTSFLPCALTLDVFLRGLRAKARSSPSQRHGRDTTWSGQGLVRGPEPMEK